MIEFTKMDIEGFCSIGKLELPLNVSGTTVIRAANGFGKAQPLYEPVLTSKGWKKMGDLTLKDKVIDPVTGNPISINSIHDRGKLPTYKVTFSDGTHTECAGDHLWSVYKSGRTKYKLKTLDTLTLLEDYKVENKSVPGTYKYKYSIPLNNPVHFPKKNLPIHPYVLGFILGDGCISGNRSVVRVSTNEKDWKEVVARLKSYLPDPNMIHIGTNIKGTVRHFRIYGLGKELKMLGLRGKKSATKFIPKIYLESSVEDRELLLAGLLDTDASAGPKSKLSKVSRYDSKSQDLRDGVVELVRSLGGISKKRQNTRFKYGRYTTTYSCSIRMDHIPFMRKYKVENFGTFIRRNRVVKVIRKIEYIGIKKVRCITVNSPEGLYITRDYIVTHNSTVLSALVWCIYGKNLKGVSDVNTWKNVRPKDYHGTCVTVFYKINGTPYSVTRCLNYSLEVFGAKGANRLIYIENACQVSYRTKPDIQKAIERDLKMSYNLFMNTIMFGQGMKRLIQESGSDQKALFEEIFNMEYLSKARDIAKTRYRKVDDDTRNDEISIKSNLSQIEGYKRQLKSLKRETEEFKASAEKKKKQYNEQIRLSTKEIMLLKPRIKELDDYRAKLENVQGKISKYQDKLDKAETMSDKPLSEVVSHVINLMDKKDYQEAIKYLRDIQKAFSEIEKCNASLRVFRSEERDVRKSIQEIQYNERKIDNLESTISKYKALLENLQEKPHTFTIKRLKKEITKLEAVTQEKQEKIKDKITERDNLGWAINDPLGNSGIKAFLFENSLDKLNEILASYSRAIGLYIQFGVNLESARKEFIVYINWDGMDVKYEELSGGQKQLVAVAMAFAMNEAMNSQNKINVTFLDEVFESLSQDNIEVVCHLIRKIYKDRTLFIITHQPSLPLSQSRILEVQKEKGISQYQFR